MSFFLEKHLGLTLNLAQALQMASDQAELGLQYTTPNPCVGCVILDAKDQLVGVGYHKKYGEAHAEVEAFNTMSDLHLANTVFVTLEPCAHQGKTPSCAKMLVEKKVKNVVYLLKDPNSLVSGKGKKILEDAGIKTYCVEDLLERQRLDQPDTILKSIYKYRLILKKIIKKQKFLNRQFLFAINSEVPYITLKWAQTLDGTIGLENERLMVTNHEVQKEAHQLRAIHDVLLVGSNTILSDNPKLNNRFGSSKNKNNLVAILDPELKVLKQFEDLELFTLHSKDNLIFITHVNALSEEYEKLGFKFIKVDYLNSENVVLAENEKLNLDIQNALMLIKKNYKINSVFVEGGAKVLTSFLTQDLFNEIYIFSNLKLNFKKNAIRINCMFWIKFLFLGLLSMKFKLFDDNFMISFLNFKKK